MRTKKFNKVEKRAIFQKRLTSFEEIVHESIYPFHEKNEKFDIKEWEYECFHHGISESKKIVCTAKASFDRHKIEKIGLRSDYTISISKYKKDEIIGISTKDMYMYPHEKNIDTGMFYIKILKAEVFIKENSFWWKYDFEIVEKPEDF